jgi:hypothetical protein
MEKILLFLIGMEEIGLLSRSITLSYHLIWWYNSFALLMLPFNFLCFAF